TYEFDPKIVGTTKYSQRTHELNTSGPQPLIHLVNVVDPETDAADSHIVKRGIGLAPCWRVEELHQVERGSVGIVANAHEDTAQLLHLNTQSRPQVRIVEDEIVNLGKADVFIKPDGTIHIANTDIHMKQPLQHCSHLPITSNCICHY